MDETTKPDQIGPEHITHAASDVLHVRRVFGEAYERDGDLVIPVAKVCGGSGSGWGWGDGELSGSRESAGSGGGGGGGFGARVKPLGVYAVTTDGVRWVPTLDLGRVVLGGQALGVVVALVVGWVLGRRRR
ncbi:MAG: spore germination protein GerW family protein [Cellulomonadaceae bacterium]